jgi:mono/diheme cytochrome c family protein
MVDYKDISAALNDRGRAYLAMNCAHCHNPTGWEGATERQFDFRYEIPLSETGILYEKDKIKRALQDGEMPFIGTTLADDEGINLIVDYLDSL